MQLTRPQILLVRGLLPSLALCACGGGSGGNSAPPAAAPPAAALAAPSVPAGLLASPENTQAGLTWTASAGAVSYHVKRSTTSGGPYKVIATPNAASYIDTGLVNGTIYYYVVSALDSAGESGNSTQEGVTPTLTLLAAAPGEVCDPPFRKDNSPTTWMVNGGRAKPAFWMSRSGSTPGVAMSAFRWLRWRLPPGYQKAHSIIIFTTNQILS